MATIRVLIADDSDTVRRAICALLQQEPSITIAGEARNYAELLDMLTEPTPNVVLMDVHMPGETLLDAPSLKARLRGSCLLAMSIWKDEATLILAQAYGAFVLLDKVNLGSTLMPAIEECMRQN